MIGLPIEHAIKSRGYEVADFANMVGVREHTMRDILSGKRKPRAATRHSIARVLGLRNDDVCDMLAVARWVAELPVDQRELIRRCGDLRRSMSALTILASVTAAVLRETRDAATELLDKQPRRKTRMRLIRRKSA